MGSKQVIVLHEWNGPAYFQAIDLEVRARTGAPPLYREVWCIRQLAIGLVRRQPALVFRALRNMVFFLQSFFLRDCVIVLGIAPFDPALLFWSRIRRSNSVVYHTSWSKWEGSEVPKRSLLLGGWARRRWKRFLEDPRVRVVSILSDSRVDMRKHYSKPESAFTTIPHAVDMEVFRPGAPRPAVDNPEEPLRVLYLGRLNPVKGIDVVADLIAKADPRRFRFGVAGDGPEWFRLEPLKGRFEYFGMVAAKREVARILADHDVLILPSYSELFGLALIEAMACGVVCIASDGLSPKSLVLNGENGFIVKRSTEAFLETLERLHADRSLLRRMREQGFARVKEFGMESIRSKWRGVLWGPEDGKPPAGSGPVTP
ncbi:MAG: glycosyl transferase group 1 [Fibrobacteres bacterium]|nr:glycosyl transferase group 1 [Fibrobacterota bacterium]